MVLNADLISNYSNATLSLIVANSIHFTENLKRDALEILRERGVDDDNIYELKDKYAKVAHTARRELNSGKTVFEVAEYVKQNDVDDEIANQFCHNLYQDKKNNEIVAAESGGSSIWTVIVVIAFFLKLILVFAR